MKSKTCREPGCENPALDQAIYCGTHVGQTRRCKATRAGSKGTQRCKKAALLGLDVCERHGGTFPNARAASSRAEVLTVMQRFVTPFEGAIDPVAGFELEYRRCLGRIAWYDEQLALLGEAKDLIWGQTKYETAGGFEGTPNRTYEARVNILEDMQRWERKHLLDLTKVWIGAGLEQRKLDLMKSYMERTIVLVEQAFSELGLDTHDPKVREVLARVFLGGQQGPIIDVRQIGAPQHEEYDDGQG